MTTTTTKKPSAGGEIDSYCTKCKLDLTHRIIAMVGETVKKVECKTCGSHHLYRRPKSEQPPPGMRPQSRARASTGSSGGAGRAGGERLTAAQKLEREQTQSWEKAIAGQSASAFKAYRITLTFSAGELVRHAKFGDGVVSRVLDHQKVEILFQDGPRTMAQAQE